jgi:uncharacterized protein
MILLDANLLIYAYARDLPQHEAACTWLDRQLNTQPRVGLPWPSWLAFVRLMSHPKVFERPVSVPTVWAQVERWLSVPAVWIPMPTEQHTATLGVLMTTAVTRANHVPDAHVAALALEHGLTLCTSDRGFARYPGLRWENPLDAAL